MWKEALDPATPPKPRGSKRHDHAYLICLANRPAPACHGRRTVRGKSSEQAGRGNLIYTTFLFMVAGQSRRPPVDRQGAIVSTKWPEKYVIGLTGYISTGKCVVRLMLYHIDDYDIV